MYFEANELALHKYRELAASIDCDFEERSSYIYSRTDKECIEREVRAASLLGMKAEFCETPELPFDTAGAVRFPNQAQMNPVKFLYGLVKDIEKSDKVTIFEDVIAVNYVLDRTEHYRLEEKERALEKSNREYAKLLEEEKKHTVMIEELTKKLQSQLELFTVSIPGDVKISNDDPEYSFKYVSEQFANMLGYATPKELLDASGYHRTAGKRQRNPDTVLFKKRRASISFYLWKSCAFKTDIS